MKTPEDLLMSAGYALPPVPEAKGLYRTWVLHGGVLHLSAHGPFAAQGGFTHVGKVGADLTLDEGRAAAAACGLSILSSARHALGGLERVAQAITMHGYVNASSDFRDHAAVVDGASEVLVVAFGEQGRAARSAVGVASLPFDLPIVIEASLAIGER